MSGIAIIGTGADPEDPDRTGYAMADSHAEADETVADCEIGPARTSKMTPSRR